MPSLTRGRDGRLRKTDGQQVAGNYRRRSAAHVEGTPYRMGTESRPSALRLSTLDPRRSTSGLAQSAPNESHRRTVRAVADRKTERLHHLYRGRGPDARSYAPTRARVRSGRR